ncbi:MAG: hypothetical protein ACI30N_00520 [Muribaculaceae bacterium]
MRILRYISAMVVVIMAFAACTKGHAPIEERIHAAETAIDSGNYGEGQEICKTLVPDSSSMTVGQLCRVGVICASLSDNDVDAEANMVLAARMLAKANALNADSVQNFISSLPYEQQAPVAAALNIYANPGDRPSTFPDEESGDLAPDSLHSHSH